MNTTLHRQFDLLPFVNLPKPRLWWRSSAQHWACMAKDGPLAIGYGYQPRDAYADWRRFYERRMNGY